MYKVPIVQSQDREKCPVGPDVCVTESVCLQVIICVPACGSHTCQERRREALRGP